MYTFVVAGLGMCCLPQTTTILSHAFSGSENSATVFSHSDLVAGAQATRDYTVGSHNKAHLLAVLHSINDNAHTPYAHTSDTILANAPDSYTLSPVELSHLNDVYGVVSHATYAGIGCALLALFIGIGFILKHKKQTLGKNLLLSGALLLVIFLAFSVLALINFDGFFTAFHELFFANGTWTFSNTSLLITLYPTGFWMGMGGVWLISSTLLCLVSVIVGIILHRHVRSRIQDLC